MERRFVSFVIASIGILLVYQALEMRLNPRPKPAADAPPGAAAPADPLAAQPDRPAGDDSADPAPLADDTAVPAPDVADVESAADDQARPAAQAAAIPSTVDEQWSTIGSLDPSRPERLLVWFTNRGAAIECVTLNDPRYLDLDIRRGYLGYLALRDTADGCRIGAVGPGTPAGSATPSADGQPIGLQSGDILRQIDNWQINSRADFQAWSEQTRLSQQVRIQLRRMQQGEWTTLEYIATLTRKPLEIIRPEPDVPTAAEPQHPFSYLLGLQQLGDRQVDFTADEIAGIPSLKRDNWEMRQIERDGLPGIEFQFVLSAEQLQPFGVPGPLRIIKRFILSRTDADAPVPNTGFHLEYEIVLRNEASTGPAVKFAYQQNGPTGLPLEGWWYTYKTHPRNFGGAGIRDVIFKVVGGRFEMFTNPKILDRMDDPNPMTLMFEGLNKPEFEFVGVDSQYFLSALLPNPVDAKEAPDQYRLADAMALAVAARDPIKDSRTNVSFRLISPTQAVGPNQEFRQRYLVFAGPKQPDVLAQYGLQEAITYGWFRVVAIPLQWVLHAFHSVVRNYGIAIILLTVLVRGCMFPLGKQQVLNAQKMQELAPEMRRIAEQHKNDMEKRAAAQRELFRKHNYNPMAGCLPMFFQLPIFIGLYRALSVDINLRLAPLIPGLRWCSNLAGPDQLWYWEPYIWALLASPTGWLGPYLNILPLVSVAFMMVHQKMFTPPPTDEQQEMQQRMMQFMMLFFALMFFRVPAGLCLYFITSSAWGLAERKLLPKSRGSDKPDKRPSRLSFWKKAVAFWDKTPPTNGAQTSAARRRAKSRRR